MQIHGTITRTLSDGSEVEAHYIVDTDTKQIVQVGGEGHIDADEIDLITEVFLRDDNGEHPR